MTEAAHPAVLYEKRADHVALVTLNRPAARNAVNGEVARRARDLGDTELRAFIEKRAPRWSGR